MDAVNRKFSMSVMVSSWQWPWVIFTLIIFSGLIKLGLWQLERGNEKQVRLNRIANFTEKKAIPLDNVMHLQTSINDLPIVATGSFNNDKIILLDNQTFAGKLGYRVFQLFTIQESKASILVNMGWIKGSIDRNKLPVLNSFNGSMTIRGNVRLIEKGIVLQQQDYSKPSWPLRIQQVEIDSISQLFNKKLLPFVLYLDKKEQVGYKKNWQPIVMPPEKHHGYAVQWFSLAIAWLSLMLWAGYKNTCNGNPKESLNE